VVPVTRIDGVAIADGKPGPLWRRVNALVEASWAPPRAV
jgi:hypothetical protein